MPIVEDFIAWFAACVFEHTKSQLLGRRASRSPAAVESSRAADSARLDAQGARVCRRGDDAGAPAGTGGECDSSREAGCPASSQAQVDDCPAAGRRSGVGAGRASRDDSGGHECPAGIRPRRTFRPIQLPQLPRDDPIVRAVLRILLSKARRRCAGHHEGLLGQGRAEQAETERQVADIERRYAGATTAGLAKWR